MIGNLGGFLPSAAVIAAVVFGVIWLVFQRTPFGRHVAAIGGDLRAAVGAGINVSRVTLGAFMLVGVCAALSGMMAGAELQNANSTIGAGAELTAIAVVVVGGTSLTGGRGNLFGTVCAAVLLASIKAGLNVANVSSLYEDLCVRRHSDHRADGGRAAPRHAPEGDACRLRRGRVRPASPGRAGSPPGCAGACASGASAAAYGS